MENSNVQQNSQNSNYSINCYMFAKERKQEKGLIDKNKGALEKAIQDSFLNAKFGEHENKIEIDAKGQVLGAKRIVNGKEVKARDLESYKDAYKAQKAKGKTTIIEEEKTI